MVDFHSIISVFGIVGVLSLGTIFLKRRIDYNIRMQMNEGKMRDLKKAISCVTDIPELQIMLQEQMGKIFSSQDAHIELYNEKKNKVLFDEIKIFFQKYPDEKYFQNEEGFIDRFSACISQTKALSSLSKSISLIFPLHSTSGLYIGFFVVGINLFGKKYSNQEIEMLREFSFFLEIHLKYIRTYALMHEFSLELDERVDMKTIEYNALINRQKEFISLISHEIRSPLASTIFQADTILDDLEMAELQREKVIEEIELLKSQLLRVGGLISKLFSIQYYENHSVNLFREEINFRQFLEYELDLFARVNSDITFVSEVDENIEFICIDKVQFQQVITNILENAIKFTPSDDARICVTATRDGDFLELRIEDNGKGFEGVNLTSLFNKYTRGSNKNIGLGLGLYLCKKIITLHNGTIEAMKSMKYNGACFLIRIQILE